MNGRRAVPAGACAILALAFALLAAPVAVPSAAAVPATRALLPLVLRDPTATPTPTPTATPTPRPIGAATHWVGSTDKGQPVSFDLSGDRGTWTNFAATAAFDVGGCSGTVTITSRGTGSVTNGHFEGSGGELTFAGQLTSNRAASGTYAFSDELIDCIVFRFRLNQSGTWTASPSAASASAGAVGDDVRITLERAPTRD